MASAHPEHDGGYVDVDKRLSTFLTRHPEGVMRPLNPAKPYRIEHVEGTDNRGRGVVTTYLVYTAAAYRSPDDPLPGIGTAWTPVPGRTEYTLDAELQNAETAAWGRAIRAVMPTERNSSTHRPAAQARPLTARRIAALRTRADKSTTVGLLRVLTAEIDEDLAHGRMPQEVADELRERARVREEHLTAPTPSPSSTKAQLSVVEAPNGTPGATSDEPESADRRTRAERIAAKHGTPPTAPTKDGAEK